MVTIPTQWSQYLLSAYYTYSMVTLTTQHLTHEQKQEKKRQLKDTKQQKLYRNCTSLKLP